VDVCVGLGRSESIKNTPAVTRVDECTKADTGVGAAIAAGNQLENGICALFVIAAHVINITCGINHLDGYILIISQWPWLRVIAIANKIATSPSRFVKAVNILAAIEDGFW